MIFPITVMYDIVRKKGSYNIKYAKFQSGEQDEEGEGTKKW